MTPCIIWDLCQTLADTRHRLPFILTKPVNWEEFDKRTLEDKPYQGSKLIFQSFMARGIFQIVITGRGERNRELSQQWMALHRMQPDAMFMRPEEKQFVPSEEIKLELLQLARQQGWQPFMAFEDHPATIRMYRQQGIQVWAADDHSWNTGEFKEVKHA